MAEDQAPLLPDLQRLADTLGPADIPHTGNTANLLGAIVKVLEHQGVTVADELYPEEPVAETAAVAAQAAPDAVNALEKLIARAEEAVRQLEHHGTGSDAADASDVAPSPAPAATPATGAFHPEGSSEASPGPVQPASPTPTPANEPELDRPT